MKRVYISFPFLYFQFCVDCILGGLRGAGVVVGGWNKFSRVKLGGGRGGGGVGSGWVKIELLCVHCVHV